MGIKYIIDNLDGSLTEQVIYGGLSADTFSATTLYVDGSQITKPYKVYTALLTQSGGDGPAGNCSDDPQPLVIGQTYLIDSNDGTGDFTNVGAPNNNVGTYFVATGTTPNSWGTTGDVCLAYNTGAPVVTVLENTIGNITWKYDSVGGYYIENVLFENNKTLVLIGSLTSNDHTWFAQCYEPQVYINTFSSGVSSDSILYNTSIEIRVYN
jgi:hypothetical protein